MIRALLLTGGLLAIGPIPSTVAAQDRGLYDRIRSARDGELRLAYAPRPDVCGDGETMIRYRDRDSYVRYSGSSRDGSGRRWVRHCIDGPVRVSLTIRDGEVRRARVYVGGDWRDRDGATDLGMVSAPAASSALLRLARMRDFGGADDVIFPAMLADSVTVWPELLRLARDRDAGRKARKSAIFWLSQEAGEAVAKELGDFVNDRDEDREIREQAVFALSQLPKDQGVPALIRAARTNPDPAIRKKALFWLGQSDDPRALELFEEILTKG
ncbi:MAG: HEAT repeat domain-containing protein [Gemmatimonadales bacterium]